jgi:hypothetical protein
MNKHTNTPKHGCLTFIPLHARARVFMRNTCVRVCTCVGANALREQSAHGSNSHCNGSANRHSTLQRRALTSSPGVRLGREITAAPLPGSDGFSSRRSRSMACSSHPTRIQAAKISANHLFHSFSRKRNPLHTFRLPSRKEKARPAQHSGPSSRPLLVQVKRFTAFPPYPLRNQVTATPLRFCIHPASRMQWSLGLLLASRYIQHGNSGARLHPFRYQIGTRNRFSQGSKSHHFSYPPRILDTRIPIPKANSSLLAHCKAATDPPAALPSRPFQPLSRKGGGCARTHPDLYDCAR